MTREGERERERGRERERESEREREREREKERERERREIKCGVLTGFQGSNSQSKVRRSHWSSVSGA